MKKALNPKDYFDLQSIATEDPVVTTVLCGIRLRALRTYYFGKRSRNGGGPIKLYALGEFKTWSGMLMTLTGIGQACAENWMRLADAFERIAALKGISFSETFVKPPWDWSPKETARVNDTVHELCKGMTQRQLVTLSRQGYPVVSDLKSAALFMKTFVSNQGEDLKALPLEELRSLFGNTVKPFAETFRKLAGL